MLYITTYLCEIQEAYLSYKSVQGETEAYEKKNMKEHVQSILNTKNSRQLKNT